MPDTPEEIEKRLRQQIEAQYRERTGSGKPDAAASGGPPVTSSPAMPPVKIACPSGTARIKVKTIAKDEESKTPVMILTDTDERCYLPVWIGQFEAAAITDALEKKTPQRPMTYDLFRSALEACGARVVKVTISALADTTYYARLVIVRDGKETELDARPSDSIALALRFDAPIFASEAVLQSAAILDKMKITDAERAAGEIRLA